MITVSSTSKGVKRRFLFVKFLPKLLTNSGSSTTSVSGGYSPYSSRTGPSCISCCCLKSALCQKRPEPSSNLIRITPCFCAQHYVQVSRRPSVKILCLPCFCHYYISTSKKSAIPSPVAPVISTSDCLICARSILPSRLNVPR